jgi:hypothetical protein
VLGGKKGTKLRRELRPPISRRTSRVIKLGVLLATVMGLSIFGPASQAAYYTCDPSGNFHAGYASATDGSEPHLYEGASANILYRGSANCATDYSNWNFKSGWTMIASGNGLGWAQSGFIWRPGFPCWKHWAQQWRGNGYPLVDKVDSCATLGALYHAWQQTVFVGGIQQWAVKSNVNSTTLIQSNFDQFLAWASPFSAQYYGETGHANSDVPGSPTGPMEFRDVGVQDFFNDSWNNACGYVTLYRWVAVNRWAADAPGCDYLRVWTARTT